MEVDNPSDFDGNVSAPSPEDLAWVDSCFIDDSPNSDNWNSVTDALLEILSSQHISSESSSFINGGESSLRNGMVTLDYSVDAGSSEKLRMADDDSISMDQVDKDSSDDFMNQETDAGIPSNLYLKAFLPRYKENAKEIEPTEQLLELEAQPSVEDIFRVWDLNIPYEEDELIANLEKVFEESTTQSMPPTSGDSRDWKNMKDVSLDDLITGFADLSLIQMNDDGVM